MTTAVLALFAFFLVIGTTMTAVNTVLNTGSNNAQALAADYELLIEEIESSFDVISATETTGGGGSYIDVVITNDGKRSYEDFSEWEVTVRYDQTGGDDETVVFTPYNSTETDNTWRDYTFWLDHGNSVVEAIEPNHLNQHEEMVLRIHVVPEVEATTTGEVTITSPTGQTAVIYFTG
jgi:hypothetical protein